jgi:hypothetical protein
MAGGSGLARPTGMSAPEPIVRPRQGRGDYQVAAFAREGAPAGRGGRAGRGRRLGMLDGREGHGLRGGRGGEDRLGIGMFL